MVVQALRKRQIATVAARASNVTVANVTGAPLGAKNEQQTKLGIAPRGAATVGVSN